jgi:serine/threonine protein kinase
VLPAPLAEGGHDLLAALLTYNPSRRMSAKQALQHPYLAHTALAPPASWLGEGATPPLPHSSGSLG